MQVGFVYTVCMSMEPDCTQDPKKKHPPEPLPESFNQNKMVMVFHFGMICFVALIITSASMNSYFRLQYPSIVTFSKCSLNLKFVSLGELDYA